MNHMLIASKSHTIACDLLNNHDSRECGAILSCAMATFLVNAPDKETFEQYKKNFIKCINDTNWEDNQPHNRNKN